MRHIKLSFCAILFLLFTSCFKTDTLAPEPPPTPKPPFEVTISKIVLYPLYPDNNDTTKNMIVVCELFSDSDPCRPGKIVGSYLFDNSNADTTLRMKYEPLNNIIDYKKVLQRNDYSITFQTVNLCKGQSILHVYQNGKLYFLYKVDKSNIEVQYNYYDTQVKDNAEQISSDLYSSIKKTTAHCSVIRNL